MHIQSFVIFCGLFGRLFNMALSILKMGPVLFGSTENLIAYLQGKGLLATNKQCPNCASTMVLQRRSDIEDKYRYYHTES